MSYFFVIRLEPFVSRFSFFVLGEGLTGGLIQGSLGILSVLILNPVSFGVISGPPIVVRDFLHSSFCMDAALIYRLSTIITSFSKMIAYNRRLLSGASKAQNAILLKI